MDLEAIWSHDTVRVVATAAAKTALILLIGWVLYFLLHLALKKFEERITQKEAIRESENTLRLRTLSHLLKWLASLSIAGLVIYLLLDNLGINMSPLLAGAGIIGLAFGFGGQYLIRDVINGIFILLEDQYHINDVVKIGEHGGLVEAVNLRITRLRDLEGRVIYIPNGEVKTVINFTKDFSQALLNVGVAYKENVDRVMSEVKKIGKEMREDPYFGRLILDEIEMLGVDDLGESQVTIRCRIKTLPIKQWEVAREFRRRLKNRFDELNIEFPFPHRTLYWGTADQPGKSGGKNPPAAPGPNQSSF
jgi:small conductance mechanosensitive channel